MELICFCTVQTKISYLISTAFKNSLSSLWLPVWYNLFCFSFVCLSFFCLFVSVLFLLFKTCIQWLQQLLRFKYQLRDISPQCCASVQWRAHTSFSESSQDESQWLPLAWMSKMILGIQFPGTKKLLITWHWMKRGKWAMQVVQEQIIILPSKKKFWCFLKNKTKKNHGGFCWMNYLYFY